jgi:6-pyruvoyltetrahydropterin/6-carboxytetrahydropterin synthase
MLTYLTRVVHFSSAHRYYRPDWTAQRNREVFGLCANPHGHGHNYSLEVTVAGTPDPQTGFCVDLGVLDRVLQERVLGLLDHQHINHVVPEFAEGALVPTTENMVIWIWQRMADGLEGAELYRLRLREDAGLHVDYYGGAAPR